MDVGFPRIKLYNGLPWRWNSPLLAPSAYKPIRLPELLASLRTGLPR